MSTVEIPSDAVEPVEEVVAVELVDVLVELEIAAEEGRIAKAKVVDTNKRRITAIGKRILREESSRRFIRNWLHHHIKS